MPVRKVKINSLGKRRIKMVCRTGQKFDGKKCVAVSGTDKLKKRKSIIKAVKTKKRGGEAFKRKKKKKFLRALTKRKGFGLKNTKGVK